jgi:hypothetical protein
MKSVSHLFNELLRDVHSQSWNEDELAKLSGVELQALTNFSLALPPVLNSQSSSVFSPIGNFV